MELVVPQYDFMHTRPVVGFGNFSHTQNTDGCMVDQSVVAHKFALWDYVLKHNLLESSDDSLKHRARLLLYDKTIFAYAFLKFDGHPIRMLYLQDAIMSDPGRRILFCGCNQHIGKSFTLNVDAATEFLMDHGKNWVGILVSGSLDQSKYQMNRIKMILRSSGITYREEDTFDTKTGKKDNTTQISYTVYSDDKKTPLYQNLLICCPHTSSALGYPADVIWFDEWDFWDNCDQKHFLQQVAIPRTYRTKGKIKVYTNPNGKDRMMWTLWNQKRKDGSSAWHRYHFNYWDKPEATQVEFDEMILGLEPTRVDSTLLAKFTRTEGSFFSPEEIRDCLDSELCAKGDVAGYGKETAWFLDVGTVHDQSVLIGAYLVENPTVPEIPIIHLFWVHKYPVGYPLARVVGVDNAIDSEDGWSDYVVDNPSVKTILGQYAESYGDKTFQPLFGFDATGNAGMLPLFAAAGIDAVDIVFTGKLKWHMYQRFQYYMQQRFLKRARERDGNTIRGCDVDHQLSKLVVKPSQATSYKKIHHENEDDLDDVADSIAGVIHLIENPDLPSLSYDIIPVQGLPGGSPTSPPPGQGSTQSESKSSEPDPLAGQYIPSFMKRSELLDWVDRRERDLH